MSTASIQKNTLAAIASQLGWTDEQLDVFRNSLAPALNDSEREYLLTIAKQLGLDVFKKQIYGVSRKWKQGGEEVRTLTIQTGIDGYRAIAERTGNYAPGRQTEYEHDKEGRLISATAFVRKKVGGEWIEVAESAYFEEYCQTKRDYETKKTVPTEMWAKMPRTMLAKCAEARALRRAFPDSFGGAYVKEEMDQADVVDAEFTESKPARVGGKAVAQIEAPKIDPLSELALKAIACNTVAEFGALAKDLSPDEKKRPEIKARYRELKELEEISSQEKGAA